MQYICIKLTLFLFFRFFAKKIMPVLVFFNSKLKKFYILIKDANLNIFLNKNKTEKKHISV